MNIELAVVTMQCALLFHAVFRGLRCVCRRWNRCVYNVHCTCECGWCTKHYILWSINWRYRPFKTARWKIQCETNWWTKRNKRHTEAGFGRQTADVRHREKTTIANCFSIPMANNSNKLKRAVNPFPHMQRHGMWYSRRCRWLHFIPIASRLFMIWFSAKRNVSEWNGCGALMKYSLPYFIF